MNKAELIEAVAKEAKLSNADTKRAIDATMVVIQKALKRSDSVSLVGFGSFAVRKRPARMARNPRTGESIKIKASKVPKFTPGKPFKEFLNG